ncbi:MarR family winged helix-turn-helix transcriptional regulator [Pseudomonas putida]|uniref:MarR family winged helix-turn-helix transcriptional regulator n=1 Tax=Pseudomonas putida TaxID=303 RepID=UPI001E5A19E3|nr:MarR family transcriptional regulator [Pseudomonas putida]
MSMTDLAIAERVRPQSMSTTLQALEKEGLIVRRPHPTDGRATVLELTGKGRDTLDEVFAVREDWLNTVILESLSETERDELKRGLQLIQRVISRREIS